MFKGKIEIGNSLLLNDNSVVKFIKFSNKFDDAFTVEDTTGKQFEITRVDIKDNLSINKSFEKFKNYLYDIAQFDNEIEYFYNSFEQKLKKLKEEHNESLSLVENMLTQRIEKLNEYLKISDKHFGIKEAYGDAKTVEDKKNKEDFLFNVFNGVEI